MSADAQPLAPAPPRLALLFYSVAALLVLSVASFDDGGVTVGDDGLS